MTKLLHSDWSKCVKKRIKGHLKATPARMPKMEQIKSFKYKLI